MVGEAAGEVAGDAVASDGVAAVASAGVVAVASEGVAAVSEAVAETASTIGMIAVVVSTGHAREAAEVWAAETRAAKAGLTVAAPSITKPLAKLLKPVAPGPAEPGVTAPVVGAAEVDVVEGAAEAVVEAAVAVAEADAGARDSASSLLHPSSGLDRGPRLGGRSRRLHRGGHRLCRRRRSRLPRCL